MRWILCVRAGWEKNGKPVEREQVPRPGRVVVSQHSDLHRGLPGRVVPHRAVLADMIVSARISNPTLTAAWTSGGVRLAQNSVSSLVASWWLSGGSAIGAAAYRVSVPDQYELDRRSVGGRGCPDGWAVAPATSFQPLMKAIKDIMRRTAVRSGSSGSGWKSSIHSRNTPCWAESISI